MFVCEREREREHFRVMCMCFSQQESESTTVLQMMHICRATERKYVFAPKTVVFIACRRTTSHFAHTFENPKPADVHGEVSTAEQKQQQHVLSVFSSLILLSFDVYCFTHNRIKTFSENRTKCSPISYARLKQYTAVLYFTQLDSI